MVVKAIYPGTFDPFTNGHLDLISRASKIFDKVVIAISLSPGKQTLFNLNERVILAKKVVFHIPNVTVAGFSGLVSNFARKHKTSILIRGLRSSSDFEYEIQLKKMNKYLMPELESIFLISDDSWSYVSSTIIKELALNGGNIEHFIPISIAKEVLSRLCR